MSDIQPDELSAYLDGELSADRRRAVADALASDPALRAQYEALAGDDTAWRKAAQAAAFTPSVRLPQARIGYISAPVAAAIAVVLVILKLAPKFADGIMLGLAVHTVALAVALAGIAWLCAPHPSTRSG